MRKLSFAVLAVAAALAIAPAAKADTYDLSFGGTGTGIFGTFTGSGILVTTGIGGVVTNITGGTFHFSGGGGGTLTAALDTDLVGAKYFNYGLTATETPDNTVVVGPSTTLDENGLALSLSNGYTFVLAFDPGYGYVFSYTGGSGSDQGKASATSTYITSTPEPSSLLLLGTGLFGLAFFLFRKAKPAGLALNM